MLRDNRAPRAAARGILVGGIIMRSHSCSFLRRIRLAAPLLAALALAACGSDGDGNDMQTPPPPPADTTPPTVAATAPAGASFRSVELGATASDDRGVTQVEFFVDGVSIGVDMTAPYSIAWNSATATDGVHAVTARATDAAGNATTSAAVNVEIRNNLTLDVVLSGAEEWPVATATGAAGDAQLTLNLASGAIGGSLGLTGMTTTAAHIHEAAAGRNGPILIGMTLNVASGRRELPAGSSLTPAQVDTLLEGGLYLNAHSGTYPNGEVRGQILPAGFKVLFANLSASQLVQPVATRASGRAALTVRSSTRDVVIHLVANGLGNVRGMRLRQGVAGVNGADLLNLTQDTADPTHWLADSTLSQTAADALADGALYFSAETDAYPDGELRGQILPDNLVVAYARLQGLQEVPAVDTAATGTGAVTVDTEAGLATIHLTTRNLAGAAAAHLHGNVGGVNGPILIELSQDGSNPDHWSAVDRPLTAESQAALLAGGTYLNAHTPAHPGGEIRGQAVPPGVLFIAGTLDGAAEIPARGTDARGTVAVTINRASGALVVHANTSGVDDAGAAHIHTAYAGTNGPIDIGLNKDAANPGHWSVTGVTLSATQLGAIERGATYVNVHTPAFPGGEIRGQLLPDTVRLVFTSLSGSEEVPVVVTAARATAATTVDLAARRVTVHLRSSGIDEAIAAHVHRAARGTNGPVLVPLGKDPADLRHWLAVEQPVTDADLGDFAAALWYLNVHTPAHPDGAIRGQIGLPALPPPDATPPIVALVAPPAIVSGTVMLSANASDDVGVASVQFFANDVSLGSVSATPYTIAWDTTAMPNGGVTLRAEARDAAGNAGQAAPLLVVVSNVVTPPPDTTPPTVTLTVPAGTLSGVVTLTAQALDAVGVTSVRFFANGAMIGTDATAPYSIDWDTRSVANGNITLLADARDAAGNVGQSTAVVAAVNNVIAATLAQLQSSIFTPRCSGCHTGGGGGLPSTMNLSSAVASFAALVNVASVQRPALRRVVPGDPDSSYLVHKLDGRPDIEGSRMPFGGGFLSAAEMERVRSWIAAGAMNN